MKQLLTVFFLTLALTLTAQQRYELNKGWYCSNILDVKEKGESISQNSFSIRQWMPATVPGTVLTTLLNNKKIPDPFYGMNNKYIKDIYDTGNDYYTYWFVNDFTELLQPGEECWLQLRGINYKCEVFLNGHHLNNTTHEGMHLRQQYNISAYIHSGKTNRLAVLVYPPDFPGNPNGGQGGDGTIAKGLTNQYAAGWDWIQPIRDRNTGIWDKVFIEKTQKINLQDPHIITLVPGKRLPGATQQPAIIKVSAEVTNPGNKEVSGILQYQLGNRLISRKATIAPHTTALVTLPDNTLQNPRLWWPNGYGEQYLYNIRLQFVTATKQLLDEETVSVGIRQIENRWNDHTRSMQAMVNGQPIFIKGGNWIISDAMLRFSEERYDAEIRFHRDMNLNLIRIWGGAITERPEFYKACDKYGLLVFQDFWFSGDCNGRWIDPMKKEDQWTRRQYPDDHPLVLKAVADQVKLIRNHPSLAFWCGGNEITPPEDILLAMKDSILPMLDGTRPFFDYSNSDSMSYNFLGGNGDGPYGIQPVNAFWQHRTFPYNSEVGSVGVGDYASLKRFIPEENLVAPKAHEKPDSVWNYHKYIGYNEYINAYDEPKDAKDFAMKAQLINYDQYRALAEGFSSHIWDWYTGFIIWKTQNPWTALRGQMYDYYLDVNACLYGLRKGSEPLHMMMNPADSNVMLVNNGFTTQRDLMMEVKAIDVLTGKDTLNTLVFNEIGPSVTKKYFSVAGFLRKLSKPGGYFVSLRLLNTRKEIVSENFYWLPGADGKYSTLQQMSKASLQIKTGVVKAGSIEVLLTNAGTFPVAFFNRIALINKNTGERILPAFYSDNYLSVMPGETKKVMIEYPAGIKEKKTIEAYGWNVPAVTIDVPRE